MKHFLFFLQMSVIAVAATLTSCGGAPVQSPCAVEVFIPLKQYTDVALYDQHGKLIDSTLTVKNDSIRFNRDDITAMPYIAKLRIANPADSLDILNMPLVIEGGTVKIEISDILNLTGTDDNRALFKFEKAKNKFSSGYDISGYDVEQLKKDYSKFYTDQIILNFDNVVGRYIYDTYGQFLTHEDEQRVKEKLK